MRIPETRRARTFRREQTSAEARLWSKLRNRHLAGYKFIRQAPIGPYFADFTCRESLLVVEVDGATHSADEELRRDARRTAFLESEGYAVLRVQNEEVLRRLDDVLETILAALSARPPAARTPPAPHPDPLPASGERE
jgi:very-short-patch-repair endonuclease